jgi:hypothetical protein
MSDAEQSSQDSMDRGDAWLEMVSGQPFWPLDPRPADIHIADIAVALSNLCRFNGHVEELYSVAEHSVRVAEYVERQLYSDRWHHPQPKRVMLAALLHDASEAYLVDVPRPVKRQMPTYVEAERRVEACVREAFNLIEDHGELIKLADDVLLATEKRDLKPRGRRDWRLTREPIPAPYHITPWAPVDARARFLWKFRQLTR